MRAVLHQDIVALACCLLASPKQERAEQAKLKVALAHAADLFRLKTGKAHPTFGNGTLGSACAPFAKMPESRLDDVQYAGCLVSALEAVVEFRTRTQSSYSAAVG